MKGRVILFLFCMLHVASCFGQKSDLGVFGRKLYEFPDNKMIDTSYVECVYQHTVYDPVLKEHRSAFDILLVGRRWAKYMDHNRYICDSLLNKVDRTTFTNNDVYNLLATYSPELHYMLVNLSDRKIECHDRVPIEYYEYMDSISGLEWVLCEDTMTICNQFCHKSVTNFRGRRWEAWYCEIPICLGPWKFSGLPGLIMRVQDEKEEHVFEAISLRKRSTGIYRMFHDYEITTTRERFNKAKAAWKMNPRGSMPDVLAPKDANGNPTQPTITHLFFNPEELE